MSVLPQVSGVDPGILEGGVESPRNIQTEKKNKTPEGLNPITSWICYVFDTVGWICQLACCLAFHLLSGPILVVS